jgi:hypothetical protein
MIEPIIMRCWGSSVAGKAIAGILDAVSLRQ